MKRTTFIKTAAIGSVALCLGCLASCKKDSKEEETQETPPPAGNFEIDLANSSNAALANVGGSLVKDGIIIAQTSQDVFVALQVSCSHEGTAIRYIHPSSLFRCPSHGSEFSPTGAVTKGPATKALKKYTVTKNGSILKIS